MKLSKRLNNFPEYIFSSLNKKARQIEQKTGKKVLNLAIGNPSFSPSQNYLQKYKKFLDDKNAHYYPGYGAITEFGQALIYWYKKRFKCQLQASQIYPLLGAKDGIVHLSFALLDKGEEVLVPDPGYPAYSGSALMVNAKPVYYNLTEANNFKINLLEIEKKISSKTKFIWVNFPSNPTGQIIDKKELKKLIGLCLKHKIWIAYDNAYSEITFNNYTAPSILEIPQAKKVAIEIGSFSKTFSFAGFRIGWVAGSQKLISALAKIKSQVDSGLSLPLQKLSAFALTHYNKNWYQKMISNYQEQRKTIATYLKKLDLRFSLPKASLYIWAKIPKSFQNSEKFCLESLEKKQILLAPGSAFGKNGKRYVRASVSSDIKNIDKYF